MTDQERKMIYYALTCGFVFCWQDVISNDIEDGSNVLDTIAEAIRIYQRQFNTRDWKTHIVFPGAWSAVNEPH